jgi:gluconate 5-dehydrogenase
MVDCWKSRGGDTVNAQQLFDLSGRVALVTGGGRGIGRSLALGLAEAGADVIVASRNLENCRETAIRIEGLGRRAWAFTADLSKVEEVQELVANTLAATSRIDILVNNAAFAWGAPMMEHTPEAWDRVFDLNLRGAFFLSQGVAEHMIEVGSGRIIHITSVAALRGATDELEPSIAYTTSKGALHTLTRDMAIKLAPHGIRVNAIAPGAFDTEMFDHIRRDPERLSAFLKRMPLGRIGAEDDAKGAIIYLASPASDYVTGQILRVDGGWSIQSS